MIQRSQFMAERLSHSRRDLIFACGHHYCIYSPSTGVFCTLFDPSVLPGAPRSGASLCFASCPCYCKSLWRT
jgi:hypothetical protein